MYKSVLVPLDGSKLAEEKVETALSLAKGWNAKITLMQVIEVLPLLKQDREIESSTLRDQAEKYLGQLKETIEKEHIPVTVVIVEGTPYLQIIKCAEQKDIDLIIMSTHGMSGFERLTIGSVSEMVMRHSPISVLLFKSQSRDLLRGKTILAVDDEPDVLDVLEEQLDMCVVHKATSYEIALERLRGYEYDIAILDIMGVSGFDLLKKTVAKGIPTVMLTAHSMNVDALRKSLKGGAVFYFPKEKMEDIEGILREVVKSAGKPIWTKIFKRFAAYFSKRFGWSQKDEEQFMKEVKETFKKEGKDDF